ncbi:hypothetical protein [Streptomyces sp. NBC_01276]|uniref:hypothetical protein n=1 Tax=Streptomyces sp. NBC_01276 TaxID=2903808 RepID=UPI00352CE00E
MVTLASVFVLAGCGEEERPVARQLAEHTCFGIFTPSDLEPLMGAGETVKEVSPVDVRLTSARRGATCNVYVDGKGRFIASATRQPLEQSFPWNTVGTAPAPEPLALGDKGIVWDAGARVVLACKGSQDSFGLELMIGGSVEHVASAERRPLFTGLMKKFVEAAREQTACGV